MCLYTPEKSYEYNGGCIFLGLGFRHTSIVFPLFIPTLQAGFELLHLQESKMPMPKTARISTPAFQVFLLFL